MLRGNAEISSHYCMKLHEECQIAWDQREVEMERQLDYYEKHQDEILSNAEKVNHCLTDKKIKH